MISQFCDTFVFFVDDVFKHKPEYSQAGIGMGIGTIIEVALDNTDDIDASPDLSQKANMESIYNTKDAVQDEESMARLKTPLSDEPDVTVAHTTDYEQHHEDLTPGGTAVSGRYKDAASDQEHDARPNHNGSEPVKRSSDADTSAELADGGSSELVEEDDVEKKDVTDKSEADKKYADDLKRAVEIKQQSDGSDVMNELNVETSKDNFRTQLLQLKEAILKHANFLKKQQDAPDENTVDADSKQLNQQQQQYEHYEVETSDLNNLLQAYTTADQILQGGNVRKPPERIIGGVDIMGAGWLHRERYRHQLLTCPAQRFTARLSQMGQLFDD